MSSKQDSSKHMHNKHAFSSEFQGTVGFQGSRGSFSESVVELFFGDKVKKEPHSNFIQVFRALEKKKCNFAVLPLENTLIGTVYDSVDNFLAFPTLQIVADSTIKIVHSLLALPNTKLSSIKTVYSQLPGIGQCQRYLSRHKDWDIVPFIDTAAAASFVAEQKQHSIAAIASERAAELYNLAVIKKGIESNHHNYTRFAIVAHKSSKEYKELNKKVLPHNTGFLVFSVKDKTGSLLCCLHVFSSYNVNLHKIESRPIVGKPWEYQFLVELDYDISQEKLKDCLDEIGRHTMSLHIIGLLQRSPKPAL